MWKWLKTQLFKYTSTTVTPTKHGRYLYSEKINGKWTYPICVFIGIYHPKDEKFLGFHPYPPKLFSVRKLPDYADTNECRWKPLNVENKS